MERPQGQMPQAEVERLVSALIANKYKYWLDGGWGVDALMGKQTRQHKDLDICIDINDSETIKNLFEQKGYSITKDESPSRLIMHDGEGHRIDIHLLSFDADGNGRQNYDGGFNLYPAKDLKAQGRIGSLMLACLSPELQIKFREVYAQDDKSRHDTRELATEFKLKSSEQSGGNRAK